MPELPEVEVVRQGLADQIIGCQIVQVQVFHQRSLRGYEQNDLAQVAVGKKIASIVRRGKFIWWLLEPGPQAILVHLGMSGQVLVNSAGKGKPGEGALKHLRVRFILADDRRIDFVDQRTFGRLHPVSLQATVDGQAGGWGSDYPYLPKTLADTLARDCLDPAVNWTVVIQRIQKRKAPIKNLLLDQGLVSGIGNIYADEALFAAGVHPLTPGGKLSEIAIKKIYDSAQQVMRSALAQGGTSFDALYVDPEGNPGYFARSLQVYGRSGQACRRCQAKLEQLRLANRSATFCPQCQK